MAQEIYVYDMDETDFSNIGLVGSLRPKSAEYKLEKGKFGEIELECIKDNPLFGISKWESLIPGNIIKASVPVRANPELIEYSTWFAYGGVTEGVYYKTREFQTTIEFSTTEKANITAKTYYKGTVDGSTVYVYAENANTKAYASLSKAISSNQVTKVTGSHSGEKNWTETIFECGPAITKGLYYKQTIDGTVHFAKCIKSAKAGTDYSSQGVTSITNTTYFKAISNDGLTEITEKNIKWYSPSIIKGRIYKETIDGTVHYRKCIKTKKSITKSEIHVTNETYFGKSDITVSTSDKTYDYSPYKGLNISINKGSYYVYESVVYVCNKSSTAGKFDFENNFSKYFKKDSGSDLSKASITKIFVANTTIEEGNGPASFSAGVKAGYFTETSNSGFYYWTSGMSVTKGKLYTDNTTYVKCIKSGSPTSLSDTEYFEDSSESKSYIRTTWSAYTLPNLDKEARQGYKKADKKDKSSEYIKSDKKYTITQINRDYESVKVNGLTSWFDYDLFDWTEDKVTVETDAHDGGDFDTSSVRVKPQLFRIYDETLTDESSGTIKINARAIAYDLLGNMTTYASDTSGDDIYVTCQDACKGILDNAINPHNFEMHCNVLDTRVDFDARDMNCVNAILDESDGIIAKWTTVEVFSDDYDIYVLQQVGMDRGFRITYGHNLTGVECEEDLTEVITAVRPVGENSTGGKLYLDGIANKDETEFYYNQDDTLKEDYYTGSDGKKYKDKLDSGYRFFISPSDEKLHGTVIEPIPSNLKTNLPVPVISSLEVSDATVDDDGENVTKALARERLATAAINEFKQNKVDEVILKLTVEFSLLGDTEEYSQYKQLEKLFIYDTVIVGHKPLGIEAETNCTSITYDLLSGEYGKYSEVEFGKVKNQTVSVASWQVKSINGRVIQSASVSSGAISSVKFSKINDAIKNIQKISKSDSGTLNYIRDGLILSNATSEDRSE